MMIAPAAGGCKQKTVMITSTPLRAHRTAAGMGANKGGRLIGRYHGRHEHLTAHHLTSSQLPIAVNSGACCLRLDIADLCLVEDQQTANHGLSQCPNFGGRLDGNVSRAPLRAIDIHRQPANQSPDIHSPMPAIIMFSLRDIAPSGTFDPPPIQAHFSSRLSM